MCKIIIGNAGKRSRHSRQDQRHGEGIPLFAFDKRDDPSGKEIRKGRPNIPEKNVKLKICKKPSSQITNLPETENVKFSKPEI